MQAASDPDPQSRPRRRGFARSLRRLGPLVGVLFLLSGGLIMLLERSLLYPAQHMKPRAELDLPPGAERWWAEHGEGRTAAHFYPGEGVSEAAPGPVVLFAHGNAEFIEDYEEAFPMYRALGVSVLLVEYRGCGHSTGRATKRGITADHLAFFDRLAADPRVDPAGIVLHGRSMGGGIVATVAAQRPAAAALILESTYTSISRIAWSLWVPGFLIRDDWDVTAALALYEGPVLIVHSEIDEVLPYAMGEANAAARPDATFHTYRLSHLNPMPSQFFRDAEAFFRANGVLPAESPTT
ncbi:alpha/beta hydrolase [Phycisphaera mikurensis]|uniref:Serine aminopeptidase S33 domain-containing protein n=1 Tax=Phycisphaera mikurensis (strain NBRC 102666 / KCTC 22515 / FYK2301M01) TaxID=1142394 RepID=I0IIX7_PHYMF|nr:alpha/beta hydrolase [Phycisphaera mikurensis]MBB6443400.1 hypothetical protein [Phycisphaera mikurensis]BAM05215.1 hypothetical protein PSMK_30560 [Phycisphaera mikurensis NBRC 102666]